MYVHRKRNSKSLRKHIFLDYFPPPWFAPVLSSTPVTIILLEKCRARDSLRLTYDFTLAAPTHLLQQLHNNPSQQNFDDLTDAVTKSVSKKAEMALMDIFVLALEYIKNVSIRVTALLTPNSCMAVCSSFLRPRSPPCIESSASCRGLNALNTSGTCYVCL